ncbi:hypothetical protein BV898_14030 [Hypsibius exemplaris]|uniref:Receptor ligand binding region domain-containing protein n=1 Tax=Hypsibius exemplaris TaxID=2072580 RepID=A0A1W0W907_HYPEX|nr:hypothetical protein BV898_14030 [Hypsibius exemplaris]
MPTNPEIVPPIVPPDRCSVYADPVIRTKSMSPTWISTTPAAGNNFHQMYHALFRRHNWTTVYFINDDSANPFYSALCKSVFQSFQSRAGNQGTFRTINSTQDANYTSVLNDFRTEQAFLENMTTGDYVYVALDTFHNILSGNFLWMNYDPNNSSKNLNEALKSLLVISLGKSVNTIKAEGQYLEAVWRIKAQQLFNYTPPEKERATPLTYASHAALEIFGQVLKESMNNTPEFDPSDGAGFARRFLHRRFETSVSDVYIDEVGEPRVNLVLRQFRRNSAAMSISLTTVAVQYSHNGTLIDLLDLHWQNGSPPRNEPLCGFLGQNSICYSTLGYAFVVL